MTEARSPRELFRPEALAHHARSARAGSVLPLSRRGLALPFWLLVLSLVAAVTALVTVRADERARGAARVGPSPRIAVYFPVAVAADLRSGRTVVLRRAGNPTVQARLVGVGPAVTGSLVAQRLGTGGIPAGLDAAVTTTAVIAASHGQVAPGVYRAEIVLRRQPIARLLVPGFRSLVGRRE